MNAITKHTNVVTMTSIELVEVINSLREEGKAELRHDHFMVKLEKHPGIDSPKFLGDTSIDLGMGRSRKSKCYHLPKREAELMVMSESLAVQTKVYDRMTALEAAITSPRVKSGVSDLSALRSQRAIALAIENGDKIKDRMPTLGAAATQSLYAILVNAAAGSSVIPLAAITEKLLSAGDVGALLGVSRNMIGRIANQHNLKTEEHGEWIIGQGEFNPTQRPTFVYNSKAIEKLRSLIAQSSDSLKGEVA